MSTKKRPGVPAAVRLSQRTDDVSLWENVERQFDDVVADDDLKALHAAYKSFQDNESLSKDELLQVVNWKFAVGKSRVFNLKYLKVNKEETVKEQSKRAIAKAKKIDAEGITGDDGETITDNGIQAIKNALAELTELKGVGPATASAVLSLVKPTVFCYMYDEVIDCFEPKRDYSVPVYIRVNAACLKIAKDLGDGWDTTRVAMVLWTAARVLAAGGEDLTAAAPKREEAQSTAIKNDSDEEPQAASRKRRKKA